MHRYLKHQIRRMNPNFLRFTLDSSFIYESIYYQKYYDILSDKNSMKPNKNQYDSLISIYNNILDKCDLEKDEKYINIRKEYYDYFFLQKPIIQKLNHEGKNLFDLIQQNNSSSSFSIRKLANQYSCKFGMKLSKSKVYNLLKYNLKFRYLKTSVKTSKATSFVSKKQNFFFIKIISRILLLKGNIIFIDESGFSNKNINYRTWRRKNDNCFQNAKKTEKINLILAVLHKKIYVYKFDINSTNSEIFKLFMENMIKNMTEQEIKQSVFFLDNLACHKTLEVYKFYSENKLKVLFNTPYYSSFNTIE